MPPLDALARVWPTVEPILKRATDRVGAFEPIDLLRLAFAGRMGIWLVVTEEDRIVAVAVTELKEYPRTRVLEVPFIAGIGLKYWHQQLLGALEDHAHTTGCSHIMGYNRRGWARFGFEEKGVVLERRISVPYGKVN